MKRINALIILSLVVIIPMLVVGMVGTAFAADRNYITGIDPSANAETLADFPEALDPVPESEPGGFAEPLDWPYLGTIAGAAAFALLIVQYTKVPLDKIWRIPTKLFVYAVCLIIMLVATSITQGLTADNALLVIVNALLAAITAYGGYEVTYKHIDAKKDVKATVNIT